VKVKTEDLRGELRAAVLRSDRGRVADRPAAFFNRAVPGFIYRAWTVATVFAARMLMGPSVSDFDRLARRQLKHARGDHRKEENRDSARVLV
jgi:hypothetical protein